MNHGPLQLASTCCSGWMRGIDMPVTLFRLVLVLVSYYTILVVGS